MLAFASIQPDTVAGVDDAAPTQRHFIFQALQLVYSLTPSLYCQADPYWVL